MRFKIVIGANYGDEGKGRAVESLVEDAILKQRSSLVVLNNGGPQRGHTVQLSDGTRHVFHHFGSGSLMSEDTLITDNFYVNPILFIREWKELQDKIENPDCLNIYVDENCTITTPYEMIANQIISTYIGATNTCGLGIYETSVQKGGLTFKSLESEYGLNNEDIWHWETLNAADSLKNILELKYKQLPIFISEMMKKRDISCDKKIIKQLIQDYFKGIDIDKLNERFIDDCLKMEEIIHLSKIDSYFCQRMRDKYGQIIIENGQGLLLDQDADRLFGTPSKTGAEGTNEFISKFNPTKEDKIELVYVTRSYLTRHGNGPMIGEQITDEKAIDQIKSIETTNIPNQWQGTMRFSTLDWKELLARIRNDSNKFKFPHSTWIAMNQLHSNIFPEHYSEFEYPKIGYFL